MVGQLGWWFPAYMRMESMNIMPIVHQKSFHFTTFKLTSLRNSMRDARRVHLTSVRCLPPSSLHSSSSCPPSSLFYRLLQGVILSFSLVMDLLETLTNFVFGRQAPQRGESSTCRGGEKEERQTEGRCRQSWGLRFAALCCRH
ncbi:hypothetical protein E2C01_050336 [Portunus trituberculatus]|uniref:Uncharacterized protein n=1 Tax=Portunus trituberculatus TaxID=210409 RepID=A0A5B7GFM7_PORTR|nr:hypothetical protein [Portunus trituberculatus]